MIPSKTKIPAAIGSIMSEIELPGDQTLNWPVTAREPNATGVWKACRQGRGMMDSVLSAM